MVSHLHGMAYLGRLSDHIINHKIISLPFCMQGAEARNGLVTLEHLPEGTVKQDVTDILLDALNSLGELVFAVCFGCLCSSMSTSCL